MNKQQIDAIKLARLELGSEERLNNQFGYTYQLNKVIDKLLRGLLEANEKMEVDLVRVKIEFSIKEGDWVEIENVKRVEVLHAINEVQLKLANNKLMTIGNQRTIGQGKEIMSTYVLPMSREF